MSEANEPAKEIQQQIQGDAEEISRRYGDAPVVVIVGGLKAGNVPRTFTAWSDLAEGREGRMRDLLGLLQASIQIESLKHLTRQ